MIQNKYKLLSLTNKILEYRIPVYNRLSDFFNVTVAHFGKPVNENRINFKQIQLTPKRLGPFVYFKENIEKLANEYDVVIALGDLHIFPFFRLGFIKNRKFALSYWSIGVSASYNKHFDEDKKLDKVRFFLMNKADSLVFYSDYPIKRYIKDGGINGNKLFVANNTVEIKERIEIPQEKKHFLFVGSLYRAKKIYDLLNPYKKACDINNNNIPNLIIIGDGEEFENIQSWIFQNQLKDKIIPKGSIYDQNILKNYYKDAIACISPGQAGLTVLNSMAYGVPFITTDNAITGGEIFNIKNNINGILYKENTENLTNIILYLSSHPEEVYKLGKNAQKYYFDYRTMEIMVKGLADAIKYALNQKNL